MEAWPMVAEERSVFAMFAPSELHACPAASNSCFLGSLGLSGWKATNEKLPPPAVAGGDVQTARAGVSGFEVADVRLALGRTQTRPRDVAIAVVADDRAPGKGGPWIR